MRTAIIVSDSLLRRIVFFTGFVTPPVGCCIQALCYTPSVSIVVYALAGLMLLGTFGWLALFAYNVWKIKEAPRLKPTSASGFPSDAPLVSVLVPARNEASRILERAVESIAAQDYPNVEVIVVDDRSTDGTWEIIKRAEASHARIRGVRGAVLPQGWAGKVWALEQAKRVATGNWIVATDADIVFAPEAVRAAMSVAFRGRFDGVTLLPDIGAGSFGTRVVMPVAAWMIALVLPIDKSNDPKSDVALGCGAFFLMRREAHDAVGGYDAIRGEIIDDVATARALKSGGKRFRIEAGQHLLFTPMYETLTELWHGFTKNAFAGAGNSVAVVVRNVTANVFATVLPVLLAIAGAVLWLVFGVDSAKWMAISALAAYGAMVLAFLPVYGVLGGRWYLAPLAGFGNLVMVLILVNSTWSAVSGKGVVWRGQRTSLVTGRRES